MYTSDCCTTCESSSTSRRRMNEGIGIHHTLPDLLSRDECWYRHDSSSERLPEGHDIWSHSPVIHSEHLPSTTESRLDFISYKESSMLTSHLSDSWPVVIWWYDGTSFTLDRFDDDSCDTDTELLTSLKLSLHSICISILYEVYFSSIHLTDWITIESLPHHRKWAHSLSMEGIHGRDKCWFFRIHFCELDRSLIGLCTRCTEETIFEISRRDICKELRKYSSEWIYKLLRWHRTQSKLSLYNRDDIRMRPPMREEPIASEPVDIFSSENIREYCAFPCILCSRPHPSLSDRFSIFEPSFIEVFSKVMERFIDHPLSFFLVWVFFELDDIDPSSRIFESSRERFWHKKRDE